MPVTTPIFIQGSLLVEPNWHWQQGQTLLTSIAPMGRISNQTLHLFLPVKFNNETPFRRDIAIRKTAIIILIEMRSHQLCMAPLVPNDSLLHLHYSKIFFIYQNETFLIWEKHCHLTVCLPMMKSN